MDVTDDESRELRVTTHVDVTPLVPFLAASSWGPSTFRTDDNDFPGEIRGGGGVGGGAGEWSSVSGAPPPATDPRFMVVRATVVDDVNGSPRPVAVASFDEVHAKLVVGNNTVLCNGQLQPPDRMEAEGGAVEDDFGDDFSSFGGGGATGYTTFGQ
jgi:hypothetical protein